MKKYVVIEIPADLIDRRDLQSDAKIPWKGLIETSFDSREEADEYAEKSNGVVEERDV